MQSDLALSSKIGDVYTLQPSLTDPPTGTYPREISEDVPKKVYAGMFITALFVIANLFQHLDVCVRRGWRNNLRCAHRVNIPQTDMSAWINLTDQRRKENAVEECIPNDTIFIVECMFRVTFVHGTSALGWSAWNAKSGHLCRRGRDWWLRQCVMFYFLSQKGEMGHPYVIYHYSLYA